MSVMTRFQLLVVGFNQNCFDYLTKNSDSAKKECSSNFFLRSKSTKFKMHANDKSAPPLLATCTPLVRQNGMIVGTEIAQKTRQDYATLLSCIPTVDSNCGPSFLASVDGRLPLTDAACKDFITELGRVLHEGLGIGRGQRVALVLPNGPELALAILALSQWAACVPLSATGAVSELQADLERCGPDLIIGPYSAGPLPVATPMEQHQAHESDEVRSKLAQTYNVLGGETRDWLVHRHVEEVAELLGIPFCGLVPHPTRAGPFKLYVPLQKKSKKEKAATTLNYDDLPLIPREMPGPIPSFRSIRNPTRVTTKLWCCLLPAPQATRNWFLIKSVIS
jgi:AMP-binding enzyme